MSNVPMTVFLIDCLDKRCLYKDVQSRIFTVFENFITGRI